jgi:hypothetical protein
MVADDFIRRHTVDLTLRDGTPIRIRTSGSSGILSEGAALNEPCRGYKPCGWR